MKAHRGFESLPLRQTCEAGRSAGLRETGEDGRDWTESAASHDSTGKGKNFEKMNTLIWVAVVAVIFGFLWKQGQLKRFTAYWQQTMEELKKCTWPTRDELRGSTVVVILSILVLGLFTFVVDRILFELFI